MKESRAFLRPESRSGCPWSEKRGEAKKASRLEFTSSSRLIQGSGRLWYPLQIMGNGIPDKKFLASAGMNQGNSRSLEKSRQTQKRFRNCAKQKLVTDELHGVREKKKSRMIWFLQRYIYIIL